MTCVVTLDGYTASNETKYNTMSITKGAVGLMFLATKATHINFSHPILPGVDITLQEALCHQTGLENDESFDYFGYMGRSNTENMYLYSKKYFLEDYKKNFKNTHYKYNNIVWRILVQRYEALTNNRISVAIQKISGLEEAGFDHDSDGYMHGLNGMKLSCPMAKNYGAWAKDILLQHRHSLLDYPAINGQWPGDEYTIGKNKNVHPFFGWFIVASKNRPREPVLAFSVGYMSQFICVTLKANDEIQPGVQLRDPYYEDFGGQRVHKFVKDWIEKLNL